MSFYTILALVLVILSITLAHAIIMVYIKRKKMETAWSELRALILRKAVLTEPLKKIANTHRLLNGGLSEELTEPLAAIRSVKGPSELITANARLSAAMNYVINSLSQNKSIQSDEAFVYIAEQNTSLEEKINFTYNFYKNAVETYHTFAKRFPYIVARDLFFKN